MAALSAVNEPAIDAGLLILRWHDGAGGAWKPPHPCREIQRKEDFKMKAEEVNREIDVVTKRLESIVKRLNEEEEQNPDSPQTEHLRGQLLGMKDCLSIFCGTSVKDRVLDEVRKRTQLRIPHIVPLDRDGNRYGFDMDAG